MNTDFIETVRHVAEYFKEHLPQYTVMEVRRSSYHPDDDYLYMVSAKKMDGTFAVWTCWNEKLQSLNHGHYGRKSLEECAQIMHEINARNFSEEDCL